MPVKGMRKVLQNINREIEGKKKATMAGLLAFGNVVLGEAKRRVPREYGNLVGSGYARKAADGKKDSKPKVEVGFSADYALWVHENVEMKLKGKPRPSGKGKYWGPKGEARYLVNALNAKQKDAADIIAAYANRR